MVHSKLEGEPKTHEHSPWNESQIDGNLSLAANFTQVAKKHAMRVAVCEGARRVTYAELEQMAVRVAATLQSLDLPRESLVAIYTDRSIEMVAAMLGVILAGAAYFPLDPNYPETRVRETIADASPAVLLTDRGRAEKLSNVRARVLVIEDLLAAPRAIISPSSVNADDLAYVIYTSGSTGRPKGVMVTQRNVVRLLTETERWFHFSERDVWTMFHSFAFDFSVWEMWGCLLTGGRLVLVSFDVSRSPDEFHTLLADEGVTVLNQTPTAFSLLAQAEARTKQRPLALRLVIFGGEALNLRSLLPWIARHGDDAPQLINMYGITETTVHGTYRRIRTQDAAREVDSLIGEPIADLQLHLLNDSLLPVTDGEVGEICIGGAGVARGYLNRAELTAERFIADPLSIDGGRLYRSGDLAKRRGDGELVYLGRADRQVKINGFRIELGEVEVVLSEVAGIAQMCVVPHSSEAGDQTLVAYFVADGAVEGEAGLRSVAETRLPSHMRPSFYVRMDVLPMNANGKVDRAALPAPQRATRPAARKLESSATSLESSIAEVWRRILAVESVLLDENFFDAGGSSLSLISLRAELQAELDLAIPVAWLFEHSTVRTLAARIEQERSPKANVVNNAANKAQQQRESFARMRSLRGAAR